MPNSSINIESADKPVIAWFRQDLRVADNPALSAAAETGCAVLPVYIHDDEEAGEWRPGAASRWWLQQSLDALSASLDDQLVVLRGKAIELLPALAQHVDAAAVFWTRCYEPWRSRRDDEIKEQLLRTSVRVRTFNGSLLYDPASIKKQDGEPYKVFTPFYRNGCLEFGTQPREPLGAPRDLRLADKSIARPFELADRLPVDDPDRYVGPGWHPGEAGAGERLQKFLADGLEHYDRGRDRPDIDAVSRLSPHLHFGELSPNQAWYAVRGTVSGPKLPAAADRFLSELGWRDFSYYTLYHNPDLPTTNLKRQFDRFPWREDDAALKAWQEGRTGVPFVDAGMRELIETGYMHNRVRMVVASFLVKNLLIDWRHGARWFWDKLLDADLANNSASWQWVAGCGADAAPYFRIFNPEIQGRKFDPDGNYVRRFVPELAGTSDSAPDYPDPVVDLKMSRERALDAFKSLSGKA